jgi:hypothetical protein
MYKKENKLIRKVKVKESIALAPKKTCEAAFCHQLTAPFKSIGPQLPVYSSGKGTTMIARQEKKERLATYCLHKSTLDCTLPPRFLSPQL